MVGWKHKEVSAFGWANVFKSAQSQPAQLHPPVAQPMGWKWILPITQNLTLPLGQQLSWIYVLTLRHIPVVLKKSQPVKTSEVKLEI